MVMDETTAPIKAVREGVLVLPFRDRTPYDGGARQREYLYVKTAAGNAVWITGGTDGEPCETAALRELKEETGLEAEELTATDLTHTFHYSGTNDAGFQKVFVARVASDKNITLPADEILGAEWITEKEISQHLTFPEHVKLFVTLHERGLL